MATDIKTYGDYSLQMVPSYFSEGLEKLRSSGRAAFLERGFPTNKTERWRATNLKAIHETLFAPVELQDVTVVEPLPGISVKDRIRVINGQVQSDVNHVESNHKGLRVQSLAQSGNRFPSELIGSVESKEGGEFYQLNTALFTDALSISSERPPTPRKGAQEPDTTSPPSGETGGADFHDEGHPIQIQYHATAVDKASAVSNRTIIEVRSGATLNLVQQFLTEGKEALLSNSVTEIILHAEAKLHHTILQAEGVNSNHIHQIFVHQKEESQYEVVNLTPGAALSRTEFQVFLSGEKAHAELRGLFVGSGNRVHNSDATIHHIAKNCTSATLYKGIGGDKSHGIFRGLVHVHENGAGTDAKQNYNSLVLTDDARITTEPHLLIYNDDVACSHGATVGQLDEKQLFYLESRGLNPVEARKILIQSFAADVVSGLSTGLQEYLFERIHDEVTAISEKRGV